MSNIDFNKFAHEVGVAVKEKIDHAVAPLEKLERKVHSLEITREVTAGMTVHHVAQLIEPLKARASQPWKPVT